MLHTELNFKRGKKAYKFNIAHNLDEYGLNIDAALINWSVRTNDFSQESFCEYVVSKDPINLIAMDKKKFDKMNSEQSVQECDATKSKSR